MPSLPNNESDKQLHSNNADRSEIIDIKNIFSVLFRNWYLFLLSCFICFLAAYLYIDYATNYWVAKSKILVEDPKNNPSSVAGASGMGADFSSVFNVKSSADNEVQILKSRSLAENTVNQLKLNVRIYHKNGLKTTEIYQESPISISLNYKSDTLSFRKYFILFQKDGNFHLSSNIDKLELEGKVSQPIRLKQYDFTVNLTSNRKPSGCYIIAIESVDATVESLSTAFTVALSDKQSTTIDMSLSYPHPKKAEVILDKIMNLYLLSNLENKIRVADSTISFINGRIALVGDELNEVEHEFEKYKTQNNIADISTQSKVLVSSVSDYYNKLNELQTQLAIVNELKKILNTPQNKSTIPSSMIAPNDMAFGQSVTAYNNLLLERDKAGLGLTDSNPIIQNYDQQIETARQTLLRSVDAYKNNLQTSEYELKKQNTNVNIKLQQVPSKERIYLDFQRKQSLKQDLYLYLRQKQEETAISQKSTISSSRIIDSAKSDFFPYSPKKAVVYILGLFIGLFIPSIYLLISELLNIKINSRQDIIKLSSVTIIGEIGHSADNENIVVVKNSRTIISEQFRNIRTKLNYVMDSSKSNVILFTSSMGGEGKSFLSVNLGSAIALTGKKVVFMELDLRKPKLSEVMGYDHSINGYSNYIMSEFTDLNKLIKPIWFDVNCSLISSGPIPPNPTEMLTNSKLSELIEQLKARFDYVIIDCAPVGLVTDPLLIEKFADVTFYVIRERFTYKEQINIVNDIKTNTEIKNLYLILNDVKMKQAGYSSYGYGMENGETWFKKLFRKLS